MQQVRTWHWISSALCLIGLLLFAGTGITLNHAGQIEGHETVTTRRAQAPPAVLALLATQEGADAPIPNDVSSWLGRALGVETRGRKAEWSPEEVYVALPQPGSDAWLTLHRRSGAVEYEKTTRGAVALFNDLHKGRNAGAAWGWFIDIFAGACLLFALTGLWLLQLHAKARRATWPLVAGGLAIPLIVALLFLHL